MEKCKVLPPGKDKPTTAQAGHCLWSSSVGKALEILLGAGHGTAEMLTSEGPPASCTVGTAAEPGHPEKALSPFTQHSLHHT